MRRQPLRRRTGFTLVELLVVIGIIALLIGILLPALSKARAHAQAVQCMANMRSIGQSFYIYLNDNKGMGLLGSYSQSTTATPPAILPPGVKSTIYYYFAQNVTPISGSSTWDFTQGTLTRYLKEPRVLVCPVVANSGAVGVSTLSAAGLPNVCYGVNSRALIGSSVYVTTQKISMIERPVETVALAEQGLVLGGITTPYYVSNTPTKLVPGFVGRHTGTGNVLWYDGHVTAERPYIVTSSANYLSAYYPFEPQYVAGNMGYLTRLTPSTTPEPSLCSDPSVDYYYWLNKNNRW